MSSDKPDIWMAMYWGDYLKDTTHLSTAEHGAYLLLIARYWTTGEALPDDDHQLRNITKCSGHIWKKFRPVLEKFFTVENGVWRHKRIEVELSTAQVNKEKRVVKARGAANARWGKSDAPGMHGECPSPSPSSNSPLTPPSGGNEKPSTKRQGKTALPDDFAVPEEWFDRAEHYAREKGKGGRIDWHLQAEKFIAHHQAKGSRMVRWDAAWKTWYCNAVQWAQQGPSGGESGDVDVPLTAEEQAIFDGLKADRAGKTGEAA